jgi:hypothetical protein
MTSSSAAIAGGDLVFYAEDHSYWTPPGRDGGRRIPNVTSILGATGISVDFEALDAMSPGRIELKRQLGSAVHADAHALDDDDLDWATVHEAVRPYLEAWMVWKANYRVLPASRERRLYHPGRGYCGTLDGIFGIDGKRVLVDIKTGDPDDAGAHLQTAAYQAAWEVEHPDAVIHERWSVQLTPGRTVPYAVTNYTARPDGWRDFTKFQAVLCTYHEQAVRRRRIS